MTERYHVPPPSRKGPTNHDSLFITSYESSISRWPTAIWDLVIIFLASAALWPENWVDLMDWALCCFYCRWGLSSLYVFSRWLRDWAYDWLAFMAGNCSCNRNRVMIYKPLNQLADVLNSARLDFVMKSSVSIALNQNFALLVLTLNYLYGVETQTIVDLLGWTIPWVKRFGWNV